MSKGKMQWRGADGEWHDFGTEVEFDFHWAVPWNLGLGEDDECDVDKFVSEVNAIVAEAWPCE